LELGLTPPWVCAKNGHVSNPGEAFCAFCGAVFTKGRMPAQQTPQYEDAVLNQFIQEGYQAILKNYVDAGKKR
jgi:hypothetical protein